MLVFHCNYYLIDVSVPADQGRDAGGHRTAPDEASHQPHDGLQSGGGSGQQQVLSHGHGPSPGQCCLVLVTFPAPP